MFAVYKCAHSWGAWGEAERWFLVARFESAEPARALAAKIGGLVVDETAKLAA